MKKEIDNPSFPTFMVIRMEKSKSAPYSFDNKSIVVPKKKVKKSMLSESEMEAARQLVELSNGDSSSGHRSGGTGDGVVVEENNSSNSFSVQGSPQEEEEQEQEQKSKLDTADVSSNVETMDDGESLGELRESRRRRNKRYRLVLDLYRVTEPVIPCH